jgi:putative hydrolase of the HAD superfamily
MDIKVDQHTVIVFDLDDTLYNEIDYLKSAYIEIAKELEPKYWKRFYAQLFSLYRNKQNAFQFISDHYAITQQDLIKRYREHKPHIQPFAGVLDRIQSIKNKNGKVAILTDGRTTTQTNKIKALGLLNLVDHIAISEQIGSEKPDENNYLSIEKVFRLKHYYYIGDNIKKDFIAPKRLGWKTVGMIDSGLNIHSNAYEYLEEKYQPHDFIINFEELQFV